MAGKAKRLHQKQVKQAKAIVAANQAASQLADTVYHKMGDDSLPWDGLGFKKSSMDHSRHKRASDSALQRSDERMKAIEYATGLDTGKSYVRTVRTVVETEDGPKLVEHQHTYAVRSRGTCVLKNNPIRAIGVDTVGVESVTGVNVRIGGTKPSVQRKIARIVNNEPVKAASAPKSKSDKSAKSERARNEMWKRAYKQSSPMTVTKADA